ncbi:MAG TPA: hypothetical protein VGP82_11310 [Ktedonobacterales bacterium]|jgi:hypothetical protein|nr:hypothetical protein [Ktedonobacterales bacterium]
MATYAEPPVLEERYLRSYLAMVLPAMFPGVTFTRFDTTPLSASRGRWLLTVWLSNGTVKRAIVLTGYVTDTAGRLRRNTVEIEWETP